MTGKMEMHSVGEGDSSQIGKGPAKPVDPSHASTKALVRHLRRYAKDWWLKAPDDERNDKSRSFAPMIIAVCANGDLVPVVAAMAFDEDEKEHFALHMRKMFQEWNVVRYAFMSEAWVATYEGPDPRVDGGLPEHLKPANRHDRKEVITICAASKNEESDFYALEMIRDWNTGLVVDLVPLDTGMRGVPKGRGLKMSGRFMELLEPPPYVGNPALDPENVSQFAMLSVILEAPEFMRDRYEKFGQDFEQVKATGLEIKQRLQTAVDNLENAPEPEWKSRIAELTPVYQEAMEYAKKMLTDINERKARENPGHLN
jgi:hypothetical protein